MRALKEGTREVDVFEIETWKVCFRTCLAENGVRGSVGLSFLEGDFLPASSNEAGQRSVAGLTHGSAAAAQRTVRPQPVVEQLLWPSLAGSISRTVFQHLGDGGDGIPVTRGDWDPKGAGRSCRGS